MKLRTLFIAGAIAALAVPTGAIAAKGGSSQDGTSGNTRDSATGGGQTFLSSEDGTGTGAGDTVAFTAHRATGAPEGSDAATGQIQVNRRTGTTPIKFHGEIDCLVTNGIKGSGAGNAYMSGTSRASKSAVAQPFELYVSDGGKGQQERNDMIMLFVGNETTGNDSPETNQGRNEVCGFSDFQPDEDALDLFRGNVQVRNRDNSPDDNPSAGTPALAQSLSLF